MALQHQRTNQIWSCRIPEKRWDTDKEKPANASKIELYNDNVAQLKTTFPSLSSEDLSSMALELVKAQLRRK